MDDGDEWRAHRQLLGELMASSFLNTTISTRVYEAAEVLVRLWEQKRCLVHGACFPAAQDLNCSVLDAIWYAEKQL